MSRGPGVAAKDRMTDTSATRAGSIRLVAVASMIGTTIEWYDFFLYGTAAALVFNRLFFPTFDPLAGTLAAFGTYSVGFVARPIGGINVRYRPAADLCPDRAVGGRRAGGPASRARFRGWR